MILEGIKYFLEAFLPIAHPPWLRFRVCLIQISIQSLYTRLVGLLTDFAGIVHSTEVALLMTALVEVFFPQKKYSH